MTEEPKGGHAYTLGPDGKPIDSWSRNYGGIRHVEMKPASGGRFATVRIWHWCDQATRTLMAVKWGGGVFCPRCEPEKASGPVVEVEPGERTVFL